VNALTFDALRHLADGRFHSGVDVARALGRSRATLNEALKHAPDLGVELFSVRGKGYRLAAPIEFLDPAEVKAALGDEAAQVHVEVVDEIDSTSTRLVARGAEGAPSGTCLAAEWQSAGRGRRGRSWVSSLGGSLTFSMLWRFEGGAGQLGGLSLAAGEAVAHALTDCGVRDVQVKWPNDVVVHFRKLAGILVETSGEIQGPSVAVIGVGVNYRLPESVLDTIDQPVIDIAQCAPSMPSRSRLLGRLASSLALAFAEFDAHGFAASRERWRSLHAYQGRRVRISSPSQPPFDGEVTDVAPDGALVVATPSGPVHVSSAEISMRVR